MSTRVRYGGAAYGGSVLGRAGRGGSGIGVPGYDAVYYWSTSNGLPAYGQAAWGGRQLVTFPAAGLFAAPDPLAGTVTIPVWWAFAPYVTIMRVDADGTRTPVRGASPVAMPGTSRRNPSTNPKARDSLFGYTAGANTTISRLTGETTPEPYVTTALRATATASGAVIVESVDQVASATNTFGFYVRTSEVATAIRVSIVWYDITDTTVGTNTYAVSSTARTQANGAWSWATATVTSRPSSAVIGELSYEATGLSAGATVDITARLTEASATLSGTYFDGDYPGAAWIGTEGLSYSDVGPIIYVADGEAPQDVPVYYELSNSTIPGIVATSETVTLSSGGNRSWLTHPRNPSFPVKVEILGPFGPLIRDIVQGVFYSLDSDDGMPIVKTQTARRARTGTVSFLTLDHLERDRLLGLFQDGSPVLVRPPASYGEGPFMWMSLGSITEDNRAYYQENKYRTLTAPFYLVAAPLTANVG